jgi:hypothetical protein
MASILNMRRTQHEKRLSHFMTYKVKKECPCESSESSYPGYTVMPNIYTADSNQTDTYQKSITNMIDKMTKDS